MAQSACNAPARDLQSEAFPLCSHPCAQAYDKERERTTTFIVINDRYLGSEQDIEIAVNDNLGL
jgi:hypothetical protein